MGMGGETGLFDFSFEQPEKKIAKNSNPKIPPPIRIKGESNCPFIHAS
jgi:hypothetical protein